MAKAYGLYHKPGHGNGRAKCIGIDLGVENLLSAAWAMEFPETAAPLRVGKVVKKMLERKGYSIRPIEFQEQLRVGGDE